MCIVVHCSLCHHWVKGVYPLKMTATYTMLKTRRITLTPHALSHTHTAHRRLRLITLKRVNEKRGREENTSIAAWKCLVECVCVCVCLCVLSPTFYPGSRSTPPTEPSWGTSAPRPSSPAVWRCALRCYRRRLPGCRWSLMNVSSGCAPSPPLCFELPHTTTGWCCCCCCCLHHGMQMTCVREP